METVADFIFMGSKITADGDCSHEIKRRLLLGRKVLPNLDSIFKNRDITLLTKVRLAKAMVFPSTLSPATIFLKTTLAFQGILCFLMNCEIVLGSSVEGKPW